MEKTIFISVKRVTFSYTGWYNICLISIHTPAKGVTLHLLEVLLLLTISIHTPTKGVTEGFVVDGYLDGISIHTPAKRVTFRCRRKKHSKGNFNPHSHEGSDIGNVDLETIGGRISIHTPTKGVTYQKTEAVHKSLFQSTLPRRE